MSRTLPSIQTLGHGRHTIGGEPVIFHCNHYNYWLQHTVRLGGGEAMDPMIRDAAESSAYSMLRAGSKELGLENSEQKLGMARDLFAELGFGLIDFGACSASGGEVLTPVSHYGDTLGSVCAGRIVRAQNLFDQGFAAAALAFAHGLEPGSFEVGSVECKSLGAELGRIELRGTDAPRSIFSSPAGGGQGVETPPAPWAETSVDEAAILDALSGLDFSGNEEGLTPRFGVILTHHLANFYNRISFEFLRHMNDEGLKLEGETLLTEAGHRCAFNTFGGIMVSPEWDAVVRPSLRTREDWVHGMVAVVNALGWGVWRVQELSEDRVVVRIYDDYESCGWLGMYGTAPSSVSFLAAGGVAGMMNLIYPGGIADKPTLDDALYRRVFEVEGRFTARALKCLAMGDPYTEIVATPG